MRAVLNIQLQNQQQTTSHINYMIIYMSYVIKAT